MATLFDKLNRAFKVGGDAINSATEKTTPVDADMLGLMDSAASNVLKKLSWANIKATLKTYFDTLYSTAIIIQSLGVQNADVTINLANGLYVKFTPNVGLNLSLPTPSATIAQLMTVEITQGATPRVVTLKAADANIVSSSGILSSGDALPNDGANTTTKFEFISNGVVWETKDVRFDVKA